MNSFIIVVVFVSIYSAFATDKRAYRAEGDHCLVPTDCHCEHLATPYCDHHQCLCMFEIGRRAETISEHCVDDADCSCKHHEIPSCEHYQCVCTPH